MPSLRALSAARSVCLMDVYLDGINVYSKSNLGQPPFDLNGMQVATIAAIEVYASAAQIPAQFNKTSGGCGVVVIWTT